MDGRMILDPEQVHAARQPFEIAGVVICTLLVIAGVLLHFVQMGKSRAPET